MSKRIALKMAVLILTGCSSLAVAGQQKGAQPQPDPVVTALGQGVDRIDGTNRGPAPVLETRDPRYKLVAGDAFDLTFQFTPDFNQTVTVQPDGFITLKEIGDVHVEGKTVPELRRDLQAAYTSILANPAIAINLKDFQKPYFLALGQVDHPGKYDLRGDTTVAEAVAVAGGFGDSAKHSQVLLFRRMNGNWASVRKVDLKGMLDRGNLSEDLYLRSGDLVYIPKNAISKIKPFVPYPTLGMMLYR
jgi:polysaccharide export outer membrane protein